MSMKEGGVKEAASLSKDIARLLTASTSAARNARETYQAVFAIEEILKALTEYTKNYP